jgi:hypothetical protein
MNGRELEMIVEKSITTAVKERNASHAVLLVNKAVNLAMSGAKAVEQERSKISRLVCDQGIRRGLVLKFGEE